MMSDDALMCQGFENITNFPQTPTTDQQGDCSAICLARFGGQNFAICSLCYPFWHLNDYLCPVSGTVWPNVGAIRIWGRRLFAMVSFEKVLVKIIFIINTLHLYVLNTAKPLLKFLFTFEMEIDPIKFLQHWIQCFYVGQFQTTIF